MHYIYIIQCADDSYYTGYTNDIARRLKAHNQGKASRITRSKLPVKLVYKESFSQKSEALKREAEIKKWPRAKKIALINLVAYHTPESECH
ncbi:MAG: GIY-YIG nuclease family protein [Pseudomonadota bacterium]